MATRLTYQAFDRLPHALRRLPHVFHRLPHMLYRLPHALFRLPHTRLALLLVAVVSAALLLTACSDDPTSDVPAPMPDPIEVSVEGAAVAGAAVAVCVGSSDSALNEGATGEDGNYVRSLTAQENEAPKALRLTFDADSCPAEEATVDFTASVTCNAKLTPKEI